MKKKLTKYELLALHEALAFSTTNWEEFNVFLKRNTFYKKRRIRLAIGKIEGGAEIIGVIYSMLHPRKT